MSNQSDHAFVVEATRQWLEKVVIGLNLCPFAGLPWRQGRVRLRVSEATGVQQLAQDLAEELLALKKADPADCETTLLIHPNVLGDFLDYNDFLDIADQLLETLNLDGTLQIASFHPRVSIRTTSLLAASPMTWPTAPTVRPIPCSTCCAKPASKRLRRT